MNEHQLEKLKKFYRLATKNSHQNESAVAAKALPILSKPLNKPTAIPIEAPIPIAPIAIFPRNFVPSLPAI